MVKLITVSKAGKITLPREVRKEIGLRGEEQYVLVTDEGDIILKRISKDKNKDRMQNLLREFRFAFREEGIAAEDVEKEIKGVRSKGGR